jgi:predicted secreted protein
MTDAERERAIEAAGEQLAAWVCEFSRTGCSEHLVSAHFWRRRMEQLIAERSPAQVARMEVERGLA